MEAVAVGTNNHTLCRRDSREDSATPNMQQNCNNLCLPLCVPRRILRHAAGGGGRQQTASLTKRSLPHNAVRVHKTSVNTTYFADAL
jgi:hypothetical protein